MRTFAWPKPTRRTVVRAGCAVAALAFVLVGLAKLRLETGIDSFLPGGDPAVEQLAEVGRAFGGEPVVVLVESHLPRQQLDDKHLLPLLGLEGKLAEIGGTAAVYGPGTLLNQVAGRTQDLLVELAGAREGARTKAIREAKASGAGDAVATQAGEREARKFDIRYGPLLVEGLPAGLPTLHNTRFVQSVVFGPDGAPKPQWRFIVPNQNAVVLLVRPQPSLDTQATRALVEEVRAAVGAAELDAKRVTVAGVPVIVDTLAGQVQREVPVLGGLGLLAVGACLLAVPWTRWRRRLLPLVTTVSAISATLAIFGWWGKPVSLGVVVFLSVLLGIGSYYPIYLAQGARRRVVVAVVLATAASFATLMLSPLPFVRDLGLTLALGVLLAAGTGAVLLRRLGGSGGHEQPRDLDTSPPAATPARSRRRARKAAALSAAIVLAAVGWLALPSLALEGSFHRVLAGLPGMDDADRVESIVGVSSEIDIVLTGADVLAPEAIAWAQDTHDRVIAEHGDRLRAVISPPGLLPFLGSDPTREQIQAGVRLLPPYLTSAVFRNDNTMALLSFGARLDNLARLAVLRDDLHATVPPPPDGYRAEVTGLPIVAVRGQELLSGDRLVSNLAGILAAGLVLAVGLRRRGDAARAVLAAVIAAGGGLAALALLDVPLSPLTVALGSLTAAVACEFTILFAESARRRSARLRRSVLLAAATSVAGFVVLAASQLVVIKEFGLLLAGSVLLSMAAAWIVVFATGSIPSARRTAGVADQSAEEVSLVGERA